MTAKVRRGVMRWIVATSLRFRFIVVAIAVLMMAFGSLQLAKMPVDVFPEFAPPRVEIQTMCNGLSTGDVESLVTVPLEQVLQRHRGTGGHALQVRATALEHPTDLQARRRPAARPATGAGTAGHRDAEPADLGGAAGDAAAAVGDQSGDEDRHDVEGQLADRDVHDGLLDDSGQNPAGARRGQRGHLGRAAADDDRSGAAGQDGGPERHVWTA